MFYFQYRKYEFLVWHYRLLFLFISPLPQLHFCIRFLWFWGKIEIVLIFHLVAFPVFFFGIYDGVSFVTMRCGFLFSCRIYVPLILLDRLSWFIMNFNRRGCCSIWLMIFFRWLIFSEDGLCDQWLQFLQVWFCCFIWRYIDALCLHCVVKTRLLCAYKLWYENDCHISC